MVLFYHEYPNAGTPAESLTGLQVQQFRAKFGIVENVSDHAYVSNSFHCHVSEDITPIEPNRFARVLFFYFSYEPFHVSSIFRM